MALSPAHRFGQIIGEILEQAVEPLLADFSKEHGLYLDKKGSRACRRGTLCTWKDSKGNLHGLDYVLEKGGTAEEMGTPAAFIEVAWRRYTKHSRNKAQEIQGALIPLAETYRNAKPFMGAILAGVFTSGALSQLASHDFKILHFPYESVVKVLARFGVDARFDEETPDAAMQSKVNAYERLGPAERKKIARALLASRRNDVRAFVQALEAAVSRRIERIVILPLHGTPCELGSVDDAVQFLAGYDGHAGSGPIERYEVLIRYNNGDRIEASFRDAGTAIEHLRSYGRVLPTIASRAMRARRESQF
jgi:hypothetical protein